MNLWAKRIGQLVMATAFFFLSCEDDTNFLGSKANQRFKVYYQEIPLESSLLLFDSLRTSNFHYSTFGGDLNRLLVGSYSDPQLGTVTASACTQLATSVFALPDSLDYATFDSVTLHLNFDFYSYGSPSITPQTIEVYELDKELIQFNEINDKPYFNNTDIPIKPGALGSKSMIINPDHFKKFLDDAADTTVMLRMPLDHNFGQKLFDIARQYTPGTDSSLAYPQFIKIVNGLVIKPGQSDKILGFNPGGRSGRPFSKLVVHFHINKRDSIVFTFNELPGFSKIESDRSGTDLSGLNQFYQDYGKDNISLRAIHSGVGILTKLDFTKFHEFSDTIPNMIINSAVLEISSVESPTALAPPPSLTLRVLKENNRQYLFSKTNQQAILDYNFYFGTLVADSVALLSNGVRPALAEDDKAFMVAPLYESTNNNFNGLILPYSSTNQNYQAFFTMFMQQLHNKNDVKTRFKSFVLYPTRHQASKTVNRAVFNKDNIKLKIYYTRPTNHNQ